MMHCKKQCLIFLESLLVFIWSGKWEHLVPQNFLLSSLIICISSPGFTVSLPGQSHYLWQCSCVCLYFHPVFSSFLFSGSLDVSFPCHCLDKSPHTSCVQAVSILYCNIQISVCSPAFPVCWAFPPSSCCHFLFW